MKKLMLTACLAPALFAGTAAQAQKEAMGMFYQMQMAPRVCGWSNAAPTTKIDTTVTAQEQGLRVTAAERAEFRRLAEAELRADPSNCAADGMVRMMYDAAAR